MTTDLAQVTFWRVATRDGQRIFTALSGRHEGALYRVALPAITLNPSEQDIVGWYTQQAQREDSKVTQDFTSLAEHNAGEMEGVQYRMKGPDSLIRKVRDRMGRGGDPRSWIGDALRYTMAFSPEDYSAQVRDVLYGLDEKGYKVSGGDNSWQRGDSYSDLSYTIYTPDGFPVELQFHTLESFTLKEKTLHKMYEEFRSSSTPTTRKQELYDTMTRKWDAVEVPDDVLGWGTPKFYPRPAHVAKVAVEYKNLRGANSWSDKSSSAFAWSLYQFSGASATCDWNLWAPNGPMDQSKAPVAHGRTRSLTEAISKLNAALAKRGFPQVAADVMVDQARPSMDELRAASSIGTEAYWDGFESLGKDASESITKPADGWSQDGQDAYAAGKPRIPPAAPDGMPVGGGYADMARAWQQGWDKANLAAPVEASSKVAARVKVYAADVDGESRSSLGAKVQDRVRFHSRRTAHRSLDPRDVLHCYACGSGNLIGRPDDSVACSFCGAVFTVIAEPSFIGTPESVDGDAYTQDSAHPPEQPSAAASPDPADPVAPKDDAPKDNATKPPDKKQSTSRRAVNIRG